MEILALTLFTFSSTLTPGPNNLMILSSGLNYGVRRSLPHYLGICIGFPLMVLSVGLGVAMVFEYWPWLHFVIKIAGFLYLLYLAWLIAGAGGPEHVDATARPLSFMQAAMFQWLNPKAWIMALGAVASFTTLDGQPLLQTLVIALNYALVAFPCVGLWLFLGHGARHLLKKPQSIRWFNRAMALVLVVSLLPVAAEILNDSGLL